MRKEEFFKNEMGYFLERLRLFGISLDELCRLYNAHLDKAE
jgi:hypothetical protein